MSLVTFVDLIACAICKLPLEWNESTLRCAKCERLYRVLPGSEIPVLLPDESLAYEQKGSARGTKRHVCERFAMIDRTMPEPYARFATFLNLGYLATDAVHQRRALERLALNRFSTNLLFEVIGACDLAERIVLELGAGRGGNVAMIQQHYRPRTIVGLDLSMANVEFCQRHHSVESGGFAVGDAELIPFRDGVVDVILNLESSHYYPNIESFFKEVYRVLAPDGEFLYADVLPATTFERAIEYLIRLGFTLTRDEDISSNVLLSCMAISNIRQRTRVSGLYDAFLVVPGSPYFESIRTAKTPYKILTLRKA